MNHVFSVIVNHHSEICSFTHSTNTMLGPILQTGDPKGKNNGICLWSSQCGQGNRYVMDKLYKWARDISCKQQKCSFKWKRNLLKGYWNGFWFWVRWSTHTLSYLSHWMQLSPGWCACSIWGPWKINGSRWIGEGNLKYQSLALSFLRFCSFLTKM